MTIVTPASVKSYFVTGAKPTQAQFVDFIDTAIPDWQAALTTRVQAGGTGLVQIEASASATTRAIGAVGVHIIGAGTTASAQGHIGGGTVGRIVFEAITTASAQQHIGGGAVGRLIFEAATTASATSLLDVSSVSAATQAAMEAASVTDVYVSPGRTHFHPGVAKAWAKWNAAGTLAGSRNVSSITDNGVGDWTVNFTTAFSSTNYVAIPAIEPPTTGSHNTGINIYKGGIAVGSVRIQGSNLAGGIAIDGDSMHIVCFGDFA